MPRTVEQLHRHETELKKSLFIALGLPVTSPEEALTRLTELKDPDATHNCWAYLVGDKYRFSDDGEPGGTAGRPILSAIQVSGLDNVLVIVIRFFGGIKLGTGGLTRAYRGAAAECLRTAPLKELIEQSTVLIQVPFDAVATVHTLATRFGAQKLDEHFNPSGAELTLRLDTTSLTQFQDELKNTTRGQATLNELKN